MYTNPENLKLILWLMELQVIPFTSLTEEFTVIRTREALLFGASADTGVSSAGVAVKTEQKWQALEAFE